MERGSFFQRVRETVSRVLPVSSSSQESNTPNQVQEFTEAEGKMLDMAARMEIIRGNYEGARELTATVLKARAERLRKQQRPGISG